MFHVIFVRNAIGNTTSSDISNGQGVLILSETPPGVVGCVRTPRIPRTPPPAYAPVEANPAYATDQ